MCFYHWYYFRGALPHHSHGGPGQYGSVDCPLAGAVLVERPIGLFGVQVKAKWIYPFFGHGKTPDCLHEYPFLLNHSA